MQLTRRELLGGSLCTLTLATGSSLASQDRKPPLPSELVKDFVGAAHARFDDVKSLLAENPTLLNATWDWQNGDLESAIGAAGHMGRRDIALYLIEKGARTDLFVHTMLGHTEIIKPILSRHPEMINCKGPHTISLIRHAEVGGEEAKEVLDFLKTLEKL